MIYSFEKEKELENLAELNKSKEMWDKAINALENRYISNPNCKENVIRYMFILWYLLLEDKCVGYKDFNRSKSRKILSEIYFSSKDLFSTDPDYLFIVGYMITFAVFEISETKKWIDFNKVGDSMIKKAYELQPDNIVYELAYICSLKNPKEYFKFQIKNKNIINKALEKYFDNRGLMGDYFYSIYCYDENEMENYKKNFPRDYDYENKKINSSK